jgi:hypothetical protein
VSLVFLNACAVGSRVGAVQRRLSQRNVHNKRPPDGGNCCFAIAEAVIVFYGGEPVAIV